MHKVLAIDVETRSDVDIAKVGAYRYVDSPQFTILLFAYAFDDEEVQIVDFTNGEKLPDEVYEALTNPNIIKSAFNSNFERNALRKYFNLPMPPNQWRCSMVQTLRLGLPGSLAGVGKALKFPEDKQKMSEGKALIRFFCTPKKNKIDKNQITFLEEEESIFNEAKNYPDKWTIFKEYCKQDVVVEREIRTKLDRYPTIDNEQKLWEIDQEINDRGVNIDFDMVQGAIEVSNRNTEILLKEASELTGLSNPNSPTQLKKWISERVGYEVDSLTKDSINDLLKTTDNKDVIRVLELRKMLGKTSVKKYEAMKNCRCSDGRVRGLLQFYGANRTGRFAGRLIQLQNLPQNHLEDLAEARELVKNRDLDNIDFLYGDVPDTLSQLIRTALIPSKDHEFWVADFSAIEARVIAWIAGEQWRMDVFRDNGDIYCESASRMFKVPVKKHGINGHLRQKGKIAELGLGYGGGIGALMSMDKAKTIPEDELPGLVKDWRAASPNITKFWWDVDKAAKNSILRKTTVELQYGLKFIHQPGVLFIELPSGRRLSYIRPKIEKHETFDGTKITYEGLDQTTKQWVRISTYGPKLVENIVQAIARDCLGVVMFRLNDMGLKIVFTVHDEAVIDVPKNTKYKLEDINEEFGKPIPWAPGLLLRSDGYKCDFYMKD